MARVVELTSYPVKGCAGVPLTDALLGKAGLPYDRSFMVVDRSGVFRSQRTDPRLAVVRPEVGADGDRLTLRAPGTDDVSFTVDRSSGRADVEMFGTAYRSIDQGEAAAAWLSDVLGAASRLVMVPPEHDRVTDGLTPGSSGFADSGALHLLSRSSLDELNRRITGRGGRPVTMSRFRPNIVVDGWDVPHTEDRVHGIGIGTARLAYAKPAIRCSVTLVDQPTGTKDGPEPLRTLATYRRADAGGVVFGTKYSVPHPGELTVGDEVFVSAWAEDGPASAGRPRTDAVSPPS